MEVRRLAFLVVLLLVTHCGTCLEDLIAEETQSDKQLTEKTPDKPAETKKYSSKIRSSDGIFGQKTSPKKTVLDFRIEAEGLRASAAGAGKGKSDDEDEKTLAQQVADGKYGLIQNELFPDGSKRPGIISYAPNPEVPKDTEDNLGGLDKEEIWLAEDHVLVLRGGGFPQNYSEKYPTPWPPIDDFVAPTRQVEIPKNPKIPPPFPVQLSENEPVQFIRGENGSLPPPPPFYPQFLPPPPGKNNSFPFPVPPGPLPPFIPPGVAFLPPPGNFTDFDEDDPSIYYPPKYDFYYPQDNTTAVPPGPLVPGIILPPPPNFFSHEKPNDEENETDHDDATTKKPFVAPAYLPSERRPPKPRTRRPPVEKKPTNVERVFPERGHPKPSTPPSFTSPIYVPNTPSKPNYHTSTTTKPNHISIPKNKTLKQDIYIISTEPPEVANDIIDIIRDTKPTKTTTLDGISPERHPLRSLIRPQVSVNYIGKVGHLPPSTAFPFPRTEPTTPRPYEPPHGHYITFPPSVTVTPVPEVKKIQYKPTEAPQNQATFFFFEEPTQPTPQHENDVSASPIDQFIKDNFGPNHDYDLSKDKTPLYIPTRKKQKPRTRPKYVNNEELPGLNALEVDNPGRSGFNTLPPPKEIIFSQPRPTPRPVQPTTDGPFIPSNYYATANPALMHFTQFDPALVDDITMKYFTIFGQKLGNVGTTPLTASPPTTPRPRIVHAYTPPSTTTTTEAPTPITITTPTPQTYVHVNKHNKPQSPFEQYLTEITGEDQKDYVVTHQVPLKTKKPKSRPLFNDEPRVQQYYLPYRPGGFSEYIENIYGPSTTARPVNNIEQQSHYFKTPSTTQRTYIPTSAPTQRPYIPTSAPTQRPYIQTSAPTQRPYIQTSAQRVIPPKPLSHNLGQFLQEVTYTGPKGSNHGGSNLQFFDASAHAPVRQKYQKPVSLESDVLVNYRQPLPAINPDAEILPTSYSNSQSNIEVVQPPNLSRPRPQPQYQQSYQQRPQPRPQTFDSSQAFFENFPQSGYFQPQQQNNANAFVAYNLPGNGGHFYFLTPQALDRSDTNDEEHDEYGPVKRSDGDGGTAPLDRLNHQRGREDEQSERDHVNTSQEYLRRRRKKS